MGKGAGGDVTTTTTGSNPAQAAYLPANTEASKQLLKLLKETGAFKGDLAPGVDPAAKGGIDSLINRLRGYQPGNERITQSLLKNAQDSADGVYTNPETNPYALGAGRVISGDLQRQFQDEILPQQQSQAIQSGAYGGQQDIRNQNRLNRDHSQTVSDALYRNFNGIYGQERANQLNAGQQQTNAVQTGSLLDSLTAEAGGARQKLQQDHLNQLYAQYTARSSPSPGVQALLNKDFSGLNSQTRVGPPAGGGGRAGGGLQGGLTGALGAFRGAQTLFPGSFAAGTASSLAGTATGTAAAVSGTAAGLGGGTAAAAFGGPVGWAALGLGALAGSRIF